MVPPCRLHRDFNCGLEINPCPKRTLGTFHYVCRTSLCIALYNLNRNLVVRILSKTSSQLKIAYLAVAVIRTFENPIMVRFRQSKVKVVVTLSIFLSPHSQGLFRYCRGISFLPFNGMLTIISGWRRPRRRGYPINLKGWRNRRKGPHANIEASLNCTVDLCLHPSMLARLGNVIKSLICLVDAIIFIHL